LLSRLRDNKGYITNLENPDPAHVIGAYNRLLCAGRRELPDEQDRSGLSAAAEK
jgi:hypothetical protein